MTDSYTQPFAIVQKDRMTNLVAGVFGDVHGEMGARLETAKANAAFIVRAVNSHDALVSALEKAFQELCSENKNQELIDQIDSALSLANS